MALLIREMTLEDGPALVGLERLCPEEGTVTLRVELRTNHLSAVTRYPGARGYVALDEDGASIIGALSGSIALTQINGKLVPAIYLFSLRTHPAFRRHGVASALIAHACGRAREEAGVQTAWAAVIEGNDASLRTFDRAGFVRLRDLRGKALFPGLPLPRRSQRLSTRQASADDLPALATALNRYYAGHNFWRPKTPERLRMDLTSLDHSLRDTTVALAADGSVLASASALRIDRVARLRLLKYRSLPEVVNRLLAPFYALLPLDPLMLRYYAFPPDRPEVAVAVLRSLQWRYLPQSWIALVTADPLDPMWPALDSMAGLNGRVHLVAKSDEVIDESHPACHLP